MSHRGVLRNIKLYNNTRYNNDGFGISVANGSAGTQVKNNIVYNNGSAIDNLASDTRLSNNLTDQDPKFVNPSQGDFHLQTPGSPAINAGVSLFLSPPPTSKAPPGPKEDHMT